MRIRSLAPAIALLLSALLPTTSGLRAQEPTKPAAPLQDPSTFTTETGQRIRVVTVATGLVHPYSLAFVDSRTLLVAERPGRLRIIRDGALQPQPAWQAPPPPTGAVVPPGGAEGLHFIALHPQFAQNHLIYLSYQKYGERGSTIGVGRGTFNGSTVSDFKEIFVADAWETGGANPGKLFFARDGTLLVTVGDRDRLCCNGSEDNSLRMKAQTLDNDYGKILRIRDDGSIPKDNPFTGKPGALPEIYTYGNRNAYGLAYHPQTGELWESEIGPLGGDEINILYAGHNYGWPLVSMGRNYTGTPVSDQPWFREGMDNPRMFWVPSISPSSLIFYTGDRFKGWNGNAFVGALNGKALVRIAFSQPVQAEHRENLLTTFNARIRDVQQGPDGNLYVCTEQASGGAKADGTVLRIEPAS